MDNFFFRTKPGMRVFALRIAVGHVIDGFVSLVTLGKWNSSFGIMAGRQMMDVLYPCPE